MSSINSHMSSQHILLSDVFDFYFLEAMASKVPEFGNKAQERLHERIKRQFELVTENLSNAFADYVWAAALGEARHAREAGAKRYCPDIDSWGQTVYERSTEYDPATNREALASLFDHGWASSAYGGRAWGSIVEALTLREQVPAAVFVDHVVDLEHNGGCLFNKHPIHLNFRIDSAFAHNRRGLKTFKRFLNFKRDHDILECLPKYMALFGSVFLSKHTARLINKFNFAFRRLSEDEAKRQHVTGEKYKEHLTFPVYRPVEYGDGYLDIWSNEHEKVYCDHCGEGYSYHNAEYALTHTAEGYDVCGECAYECLICGEWHVDDHHKEHAIARASQLYSAPWYAQGKLVGPAARDCVKYYTDPQSRPVFSKCAKCGTWHYATVNVHKTLNGQAGPRTRGQHSIIEFCPECASLASTQTCAGCGEIHLKDNYSKGLTHTADDIDESLTLCQHCHTQVWPVTPPTPALFAGHPLPVWGDAAFHLKPLTRREREFIYELDYLIATGQMPGPVSADPQAYTHFGK